MSAILPYVVLAIGMAVVIGIAFCQSLSEKVSILKKLEDWQTGLSALIGFLAVVVSFSIQNANGAADRNEKAASVTKAFTTEISLISPQVKLMKLFSQEIKKAAASKNTALCANLVRQMQQHSVLSLGIMQDNRGNLSLLPSTIVSDVALYYLRLGQLSREIGNLEPPDCMGGIPSRFGIVDSIISDMDDAAARIQQQSGSN